MRSSKKSHAKQKTRRSANRIARSRERTAPNEPLDLYVQAAAHLLELRVPAAWNQSVTKSLQTTLLLAASFADFPLPDDAEPGPVFVP